MLNLEDAIQDRERYIDPEIFTDEGIYNKEMERIFQHTWLYVGHESSIPHPGDYVLNYMGEDEVIIVRDRIGRVRVFLNQCPHRGNKICLFDRGTQKSFTCTFHGWQFDTEGRLMGVPFSEKAYGSSLNREEWGLKEVPRVSSYGGLIFASWDEEICSLDEYLGEIRWYLDRLLLEPFLGGIEVLPGRMKYMLPMNWKLLSDNFQHDEHHVPITHASFFRVMQEMQKRGVSWFGGNLFERSVQVLVVSPAGAPHAAGLVEFWDDPRPDSSAQVQPQNDRAMAERLGREAVEWLDERERRVQEFMQKEPVKIHGSANWNIFPNLSLILSPSALRAKGIIQWHPRGPMMTEVWQWAAVEKDAPDVVKKFAASLMASDQAPAGMITIDDTENFERSKENLLAKGVKDRPFNYSMPGIDRQLLEEEFRAVGLNLGAFPGTPLPVFTEEPAREFYRYYRELMNQIR